MDAQGSPTVRCNATPGRIGVLPARSVPGRARCPLPKQRRRHVHRRQPASGIVVGPGQGLGLAIADLDDDGRLDIFVANDQTPNLLFHNLGGLQFEEVAVRWGVA